MPAEIVPSKLQDHPATCAWRELFPALRPRSLQVWSKGTPRKAAVYRLAFIDPATPAVFAKRGAWKVLDLECTIHEQILPRLPVPSPRFVGLRRTDEGDSWPLPDGLSSHQPFEHLHRRPISSRTAGKPP